LVMLADREVAELISKWPLGGPSRIRDSDTPLGDNHTRHYRDFLSDRSSIAPLALIIASIVSATAPSVVLGDAYTRIEPLSASEEHALKVKDTFRECDKCPEMVVVPAGSFVMGSPDTELNRYGTPKAHPAVDPGTGHVLGLWRSLIWDEAPCQAPWQHGACKERGSGPAKCWLYRRP
jgi:hypothetical protein